MDLAMLAWASMHQAAPDVWAARQFQGIRLGHCTRKTRIVAYARALAEQPGKTIPERFTTKYEIKAIYNLDDLQSVVDLID